jgi:hypothetical protein
VDGSLCAEDLNRAVSAVEHGERATVRRNC